eukprot:scaffold5783_cov129-Amphora_coffeaeformis.AAC.11
MCIGLGLFEPTANHCTSGAKREQRHSVKQDYKTILSLVRERICALISTRFFVKELSLVELKAKNESLQADSGPGRDGEAIRKESRVLATEVGKEEYLVLYLAITPSREAVGITRRRRRLDPPSVSGTLVASVPTQWSDDLCSQHGIAYSPINTIWMPSLYNHSATMVSMGSLDTFSKAN